MKPTDILADIGRPISFYPGLRELAGSTNATILLCQLIYWTGKGADPDGWIYKTMAELGEETSLSDEEQRTARGKLKERGLIEERNDRINHVLFYRVNLEEINSRWGDTVSRNHTSRFREDGKDGIGEPDIPVSIKGTSETTAEITSEIAPPPIKGKFDLEAYKERIKTIVDNGIFPNASASDYPEDIAPYIVAFCTSWSMIPPQKKSSQYKYWITAGRDLKGAAGEFGAEIISEYYQEWSAGKPFTVATPGSIVNAIRAFAGKKRAGVENQIVGKWVT